MKTKKPLTKKELLKFLEQYDEDDEILIHWKDDDGSKLGSAYSGHTNCGSSQAPQLNCGF